MEPADKLFGGHGSRSGDYGCPAVTFNQLEQEEDLMSSSMFMLSDSPPSSLWLPLPAAEGFAAAENFGDWQISLDEMPCIPFGDGQISSLADQMPCIPAAVAEESTNYAAAPAAPLVATHGTGTGQLSSKSFSLSSTKSDQFDEEEVQQVMKSLLDPSMAPDGLSNTTNGGPAARNHADAVPPLVQQDELRHPQQQMTPTIWPSQPGSPSPTPVINPDPDEANHAASAPMGSQGTAPLQHQETDILSRALTQPRAIKSRGLPSRLQDGSDNLFGMGIDMIRQLGRLTGICQYCNTVMRTSTLEMFLHLHLLSASSRASKETQRSSQALQIKEIPENPNGESEPIETDNSNCTTAARVDTQGTNAVVLSPRQQHQLQMDREEQMATMLSTCKPCGQGLYPVADLGFHNRETSWWDLIVRLSESSFCSSTTKSTHDGFRLKFSKNGGDTKIVHVHSSAAWMHVVENRLCKGHPKLMFKTLFMLLSFGGYDYTSTPAGCARSWQDMHIALCALGFRKEFARDLVIHALALVNGCHLTLWSPSSSNKGKSVLEQVGDAPSGKRKRNLARTRAKVWDHFTKEEVEEAEESSTITMARCNHCGSKLRADSKIHGTSQLKRHITSTHPEHAESL